MGNSDVFRARDNLARVDIVEEIQHGFVEIGHRQVTELDGAADRHRCVGLGDRHLVVRVVDAAAAIVGLEDELTLVREKQAVDAAVVAGGDCFREGEDGILLVFAEHADGDAFFEIAWRAADVGLLKIGDLCFGRVGNIGGVEIGNLGGKAVFGIGDADAE